MRERYKRQVMWDELNRAYEVAIMCAWEPWTKENADVRRRQVELMLLEAFNEPPEETEE